MEKKEYKITSQQVYWGCIKLWENVDKDSAKEPHIRISIWKGSEQKYLYRNLYCEGIN